MSSAKTCPNRYDAYTWEQVQQYNPNLRTNNIQKVQYVTNLKSLLTNRLTATDGVAKKSADEKQAASNAAVIVNYYIESKLRGDDVNYYDLILDVNVIQHDLRNQVLQRPIDKPDNKEELLKFVYPNIGYNDGQVTVTAKDVKDHEEKGLSTVQSVETQLLEAVLPIIKASESLSIKNIIAAGKTSKSGVRLLEDMFLVVFPNDDASDILREVFESFQYRGPHEFQRYVATKQTWYSMMSNDQKRAINGQLVNDHGIVKNILRGITDYYTKKSLYSSQVYLQANDLYQKKGTVLKFDDLNRLASAANTEAISRQSNDQTKESNKRKDPLTSSEKVHQTKAKKPKFEKNTKKKMCVLCPDKTNHWTQDCFKVLRMAKEQKDGDKNQE
mmetsp:Transcript_8121/g.26875  ORF Transcript_8121/g.26875 Transcript_8121/m.26875 type:complete len:386 (+) Transcript_8121:1810-2967(+)